MGQEWMTGEHVTKSDDRWGGFSCRGPQMSSTRAPSGVAPPLTRPPGPRNGELGVVTFLLRNGCGTTQSPPLYQASGIPSMPPLFYPVAIYHWAMLPMPMVCFHLSSSLFSECHKSLFQLIATAPLVSSRCDRNKRKAHQGSSCTQALTILELSSATSTRPPDQTKFGRARQTT